jgi:membrane fusion protein, multidrug efflux system
MKRTHALLIVVAVVLAAGLAAAFRGPPDGPGVGGPARGAAERTLRAEVIEVQPEAIRDSVRTVGSLAANESVEVVSELSRRLETVHVREGTEVEKGALLFKLDDADLRADLARLEVRRQLAATTERRQRDLLARNALSQQAYDQAAAELRTVEAEIRVLRVTLGKTEIRAPFRARAGLRRVSEGAWLTPATLLTTLQDVSRIKIDFSLPERYAGAVTLGQRFEFSVAGRGERFEGTVIAIEPQIEAASRSLRVRGLSENPSGALVPGAFASLEIPVEQKAAGILVPAQAVAPTSSGHGVYVLVDGRAELREVRIGLRTQESVEIQSGLTAGERVITSNLLRMRPGVRIEVVPAAAPGASAAPPTPTSSAAEVRP